VPVWRGPISERASRCSQAVPGENAAGWLDQVVRKRLDRKVEHAFSLLSLVHDSDALQLSLRALHADDRVLRGTALEYLDNVLHAEMKTVLWPHLHVEPNHKPSERDQAEVLEELLRTADGLVLDPALLKGRS
jgi:hypothetical protein